MIGMRTAQAGKITVQAKQLPSSQRDPYDMRVTHKRLNTGKDGFE